MSPWGYETTRERESETELGIGEACMVHRLSVDQISDHRSDSDSQKIPMSQSNLRHSVDTIICTSGQILMAYSRANLKHQCISNRLLTFGVTY